ncbi:MAG: AAA family ATPase [Myxococcales bacterium]|nr:AAA family ATPase [Myxococcales bacterium]MCB9691551.1 AAA family ATPase [Alphaproteobacteria bacterium]
MTAEGQAPSEARGLAALRASVCEVVHGKEDVVDLAITAMLAGGHVLLEDVPGVGKTTLAHALASAVGGTFRRVQFTSDLLPGDITGTNVLDPGTGAIAFRPGPLFANVVLADEINRTTPRTQSALFEAMAEAQVTVDGSSRPLPTPFLVIATQNPWDHHGTYALPESQLDRFLLRLSMGYPDREAERAVLRTRGRHVARTVLEPDDLLALQARVDGVRVADDLEDLLLDVVERTRSDPRLVRGVSTRGARALYRALCARAVARGRAYAIPDDLRDLAVPVLAHRVLARRADEEVAAIQAIVDEVGRP